MKKLQAKHPGATLGFKVKLTAPERLLITCTVDYLGERRSVTTELEDRRFFNKVKKLQDLDAPQEAIQECLRQRIFYKIEPRIAALCEDIQEVISDRNRM